MSVAVVDIQPVFDVDFRQASLLISVFYVTSAVGQPVMGRFADRFGRRRLFLIGLVVAIVVSAAAPFSPSFAWLLVIRTLQALGTSTLYPAGFGIVRETITERQSQALSVLAMSAGITAALGPTIGGSLVTVDWYAVFAINAPICTAIFVVAWYVLPPDSVKSAPSVHGGRGWIEAFDVAGVVLFTVSLVSLLWFLLTIPVAPAWVTLGLGFAAGGLFVARELRAREPIIDLPALSANRPLIAIYVQYALVNIVFYSVVFGIPSYLQEAHGYDAVAAGVTMLPLSGMGVLILPLVARMIERVGPRRPLIAGAAFMLAGSLLLLGASNASGPGVILLTLAVFGIANGLNNLGLQAALYNTARPEHMSAAAGLFQTSRYLGTILSTSILGIAFSETITSTELHAVALVLAGVAVPTIVLSWRRHRPARPTVPASIADS